MRLTNYSLKEVLDYDPETGLFVWIVAPGFRVKVGDVAGTKSHRSGYVYIKIKGKSYGAHRLAFLYMEGYLPENEVDHKDRVRHHNWWDNLRELSRTCNTRNCSLSKLSKSGVTGVTWHKQNNKWQAQVKNKGKTVYLGVFQTTLEAAQARYAGEIKYGYPNCQTESSALKYIKEVENGTESNKA